MHKSRILLLLSLALAAGHSAKAQVGDYRNDLSIGGNAGYVLSNVSFVPKVNQSLHGGMTAGFSYRYVCEKYFNTICSLYGEVNYAQMGWKERLLDVNEQPVYHLSKDEPERFSRTVSYVQVPVFAHLAWGREQKGLQFFVQAGPQIGFYLGDEVSSNFELEERNRMSRVSDVVQQDSMAVEHKFDYGIAAGLGAEYSHPKLGHFLVEARYYYGLGNLYGDSKRDFFGRSNHTGIIVKLTYLCDMMRTRRNNNH